MVTQFQHRINKLVSPKESILLAVSGGVDSMVLLDLFLNSNYNVAVAHCNFQLREQAAQEVELVKEICEKNNIRFHYQAFETKKEVERSGESTQMVARRLRYAFFDELREKFGYQFIATAHHANDNLETILLNLTKGTGIRGMIGIAEKTDKLVRPLLRFTKKEILDYAMQNQVAYFNDASNASNDYQRNFIRNEVVPLLRSINPEVEQTSIRSIDNLKFANQLFQQQLDKQKRKLIHEEGQYHVIYKRQLLAQHHTKQLLFELLSDFGFVAHQVETIFNLLNREHAKPSEIYSSQMPGVPYCVVIDSRQRLLITKKENLVDGFYELSYVNQEVSYLNKTLTMKEVALPVEFTNNPNEVFVDADKLDFPLQLRKWTAGDYFYPLGLGKKKKISKFLINEKVDKLTKEQQYVLTSGQKIVWVVGRRIDDRFKVTEKTKRVISLKSNDLI